MKKSRAFMFLRLSACIGLCLTASAGWCQIVVSSNAVLSITPSVKFYASGDFVNNGTVQNNGNLFITGAWTNAGTYEAESGTVTFDGDAQQVINHNAQSFARLIISGGGEKVFKADITIENELALISGVLVSQNNSKIVLSETSAVTGGSATSYVQGPVHSFGTGKKIFPVGISGNYLPLTFTDVAGASPDIGVQVVEPNPISAVNNTLVSVSPKRYWNVSVASGTFTGSPVTLTMLNESFAQPANVVVAQTNNAADPFISLGKSDVSGTVDNGTVTSKNFVTASILAVAEEKPDVDKTIIVYNAVTPGNDNQNDFLHILNIEYYPKNVVTIVNRWGDKVFEMEGYDNTEPRRFNGDGNVGGLKALLDGTYYYIVNPGDGAAKMTGFFILRR